MEQKTPTVKITPPSIKIDWLAKEPPYVEVWNEGKLLMAGWVYASPDYVEPEVASPFGPVQAGLVTPDGRRCTPLALVPEPCFDSIHDAAYVDDAEPYHGKARTTDV